MMAAISSYRQSSLISPNHLYLISLHCWLSRDDVRNGREGYLRRTCSAVLIGSNWTSNNLLIQLDRWLVI